MEFNTEVKINDRLSEKMIVQHFKRETVEDQSSLDYLYIIDGIAYHTETKEKLVCYRALYRNDAMGVNFGRYVRPYDMFVSEVDHEKYPDIKQKYRFEPVKMSESEITQMVLSNKYRMSQSPTQ